MNRSSLIKKSLSLVVWILVFQGVGFLMSQWTRNNMPWYAELTKSSLTPPNAVFGIAWTILYIMIAIAGWSLWQHRHKKGAYFVIGLFVIQALLNWLWTPLFFSFHLILAALICIIVLVLVTGLLIIKSFQLDRFAAFMLIPYFLWLCFATYLNWVIWLTN